MTPIAEPLPPNAPQRYPRWLRLFAATWLRLLGWKLVGRFPDEKQLLIVVAPHSSAWDGLYGLLIKVAVGIDIRFMAKREAFWFPLGLLLKGLGAIPIDPAIVQDTDNGTPFILGNDDSAAKTAFRDIVKEVLKVAYP